MSLNTGSINGSEPSSASATSTSDSDTGQHVSFQPSHKTVIRKMSNLQHDLPTFVDADEIAKKSNLVINPPASTSNRISISAMISNITVEPTILLYTFCFMIYQPVFSYQVMHTLCRQSCSFTEAQCLAYGKGINKTVDVHVQKTWAEFENYSTILNTAPGIIFALFMGPWSDVFGRKKLLSIPFIGAMGGSIFATLLYFLPSLPIWTLFVPNFLLSLAGAMIALITGGFAYAVDVSHEGSSRTIRIALVSVCITVGMSSAGLLSGLLINKGAPYYVCYAIALVSSIIGYIYTVFFLKETRRPDRYYTRLEAFIELFKIHHLVDSARTIIKKRSGFSRLNLWLLFVAILVQSLVGLGIMKIREKFYTASPLSWSLSYFMLFDGLWGIVGMIAGGLFTGVTKRQFKWSDITLGLLGCVSNIARDVIIGFARTTSVVYVAYALGILNFLVSTASRAMMSKFLLKSEQGKLFSLLAAIEGFMPMLGSVIMTAIFTAMVSYWPGFFSLVGGCTDFIPLILLILVVYFMRRDAGHLTKDLAPDVSSENLVEFKDTAAT